MSRGTLILCMLSFLLSSFAEAQEQKPSPAPDAPNVSAPGHNMSDMPGMDSAGGASAMRAMEGHHMDMGPHMKMTALRDTKPGDAERAAQVAEAARKVAEKYTDYKVALADGFRIFMPNVPQKMYHFTNYGNAFEAVIHFDPGRPTSLLYEKRDDGYKLISVMYTAAKNAGEDELDQRIPLSVAQWHAHINLSLPPRTGERKFWCHTRNLGCKALSPHKLPATPLAENSFPKSSGGWCMSIRSRTSRKTSGQWSGKPKGTWIEV